MRLIDADALEERMGVGVFSWEVIKEAPTIESAPVRHGQWVKRNSVMGFTDYSCSFCKCFAPDYTMYCPHCGARMGW